MKNPLVIMLLAAKTVLKERRYKIWFAIISIVFISAYILFPVWHMSGNTVSAQLSILTPYDYFLFVVLSSITALLLLTQIFLFSRSRRMRTAALVGQGGVGIFSAFFAAILATATCFSCAAAILGFLGAGSIFFISKNKSSIVTGVIAFMLLSLYFSARRIEGLCKKCEPLTVFPKK